jgi:(p)ppGpp synthase/HD superfamily hydrolase
MLEEAALLVRKYFAGKTRRGNGAPYEAHLLACQSFVASYKGRAPTQAAALLHDILEETLVSPAMLRDVVDDQVTSMVIKLTEDKALSWYERKARVVAMAKHCCQETFDRFRNGLYWTPDGLVPDEVPNSRPYLSIGG